MYFRSIYCHSFHLYFIKLKEFFLLFKITLLCFLHAVFFRLKDRGTPSLSKSTGAIFPKAFAHFVSLGHMLVMLTIFQTFSLLLCLLW